MPPLFLPSEKEQQKQYGDKKNRGERVHLRLDSLADFGINLCGERINARSLGEVGDNEIIEGHRKGEQKARNNARHDVREDNFPECIHNDLTVQHRDVRNTHEKRPAFF